MNFIKNTKNTIGKFMAESKISVIMPVYNGEKYLKEAIESILSQIINYSLITFTSKYPRIFFSHNSTVKLLIHKLCGTLR